jgi:hypothetical protein
LYVTNRPGRSTPLSRSSEELREAYIEEMKKYAADDLEFLDGYHTYAVHAALAVSFIT